MRNLLWPAKQAKCNWQYTRILRIFDVDNRLLFYGNVAFLNLPTMYMITFNEQVLDKIQWATLQIKGAYLIKIITYWVFMVYAFNLNKKVHKLYNWIRTWICKITIVPNWAFWRAYLQNTDERWYEYLETLFKSSHLTFTLFETILYYCVLVV